MHPTVADVASPFLPSIRHAKSAPPCKAKTLANAQVFRASTAEIYPLTSTKTQNTFCGETQLIVSAFEQCSGCIVLEFDREGTPNSRMLPEVIGGPGGDGMAMAACRFGLQGRLRAAFCCAA